MEIQVWLIEFNELQLNKKFNSLITVATAKVLRASLIEQNKQNIYIITEDYWTMVFLRLLEWPNCPPQALLGYLDEKF